MAMDLENTIMQELGFTQDWGYFEGSQCDWKPKRVTVNVLPLIINKYAETGYPILPAQSRLFTMLDETRTWEPQTSVRVFQQATRFVIALHIHAFHRAEGPARQEYLEIQEKAIRKNLQPGWEKRRRQRYFLWNGETMVDWSHPMEVDDEWEQ